MAVKKRSKDKNDCRFTGRLLADPVLTEIVGFKKEFVDQCTFSLACNSNPFTNKMTAVVPFTAYGALATRIAAKMAKGYGVLIDAEYHTRPDTPPFFKVNSAYIISIPQSSYMEEALSADGNEGAEDEVINVLIK